MQQMVRTFGQRLSEILFVKRLHIGVFMRETKGHLVVKSPQDIPARLGALLAVVNRLAAAACAATGAGHDLNEVILHVAGGNRLHELPGVAESTDHRRADRACTGNVETRFLPALHAAHSSKGIGVRIFTGHKIVRAAKRCVHDAAGHAEDHRRARTGAERRIEAALLQGRWVDHRAAEHPHELARGDDHVDIGVARAVVASRWVMSD